jgi:hypothetical protein
MKIKIMTMAMLFCKLKGIKAVTVAYFKVKSQNLSSRNEKTTSDKPQYWTQDNLNPRK